MPSTLLVRQAVLVAPSRCRSRTASTFPASGAKTSSVGRRIRGHRRSFKPTTTTLTPTTPTMTRSASSSSPLLPTPSSSPSSSPRPPHPPRVRFRRGNREDADDIFRLVLGEKMNPFGLHPERFLVAEEEEEGEEGETEGGGGGGGSKEGRSRLVAFGQLVELGEGKSGGSGSNKTPLFEIRSLVTTPEFRGKGIGAEVVRRLLDEASARKKEKEKGKEKEKDKEKENARRTEDPRDVDVVLTTIGRRLPFYERLGFLRLPSPPKELLFEVALGSVVARIAVGDSIIALGKRLED